MTPRSVPSEATSTRSTETEAETARRRLRRRTAQLTREELDEALASLDADGSLTEPQREAIEEMSVAIAEGVLAPFDAPLKEDDDHETARTVRSLFDLEE